MPSLTPEDELTIREALVSIVTNAAPEIGRVIPAPLYFAGKQDYWASLDGAAYNDQKNLETRSISFVSIYLVGFEDQTDSDSPADSPMTIYTYEFYRFQEYDYERVDENVTPDAFQKKMLKNHNDFVKSVLNMKSAFQGERNIAGLPINTGLDGSFTTAKTFPLNTREEVQNRVECEFVPGVVGHTIKLGEGVRIQYKEC